MKNNWILKHEIKFEPDSFDQKFVDEGKYHMFEKADNEILVKSETIFRGFWFLFGGILSGVMLFIGLIDIVGNGIGHLKYFTYINIPLMFPGVIIMLYSKMAPEKKIVFHRLSGLVEIPGFLFEVRREVMFDDLKACYGFAKGGGGALTARFPNQRGFDFIKPAINLPHPFRNPGISWSFLVWYMDRNRPLPPGTVFDSYRKKDDERRTKAGNPQPLYPFPAEEERIAEYKRKDSWKTKYVE